MIILAKPLPGDFFAFCQSVFIFLCMLLLVTPSVGRYGKERYQAVNSVSNITVQDI
jgi:hypothetical protein